MGMWQTTTQETKADRTGVSSVVAGFGGDSCQISRNKLGCDIWSDEHLLRWREKHLT